jgi:hypothetical protein
LARLNASYGSELHLLRMLGRHRHYFDGKVRKAIGADSIEWLDFPSGEMRQDREGHVEWDREWRHFNFLADDDPAKRKWATAWPTHRQGHNWDAIGRIVHKGRPEWLLVEAKANIGELKSHCSAADQSSRELIEGTLNATKMALGARPDCDWTTPYYQFCNRLAALHVIDTARTPARLLFVYFCGDFGGGGRDCPVSEPKWKPALDAMETYVGLPADHRLRDRVHKVFVDVQCRD